MPIKCGPKDHTTERSATFLAAASSAILLSFAHVYSELWLLSLFALVPFLWRLCQVNLKGAVSLGLMLATFFVCATSVRDLIFTPKLFLFKLLALNVTFIFFGLTINRARKYLGFDPLFIALLWFPIEYVLIEYAGLGSLFSVSNSGSSLVIGFCSLFGILLGSFAIVLINSLTIMFITYVEQRLGSNSRSLLPTDIESYPQLREVILERVWYNFPDRRSPPWKSAERRFLCGFDLHS
jgi:apolipoprotein N-acyltransferase